MNDKLLKASVAVAVPVMTLSVGGVTFADTIPANPMGTSSQDARDDTVTWVMTYGVPVLAGATVFGILIRAGFKWLRRIGNRAAA